MAFMNDNKRYNCKECGKAMYIWLDLKDTKNPKKEFTCKDHDPDAPDRYKKPIDFGYCLYELCREKEKHDLRLLTTHEKMIAINRGRRKSLIEIKKAIDYLIYAPSYKKVKWNGVTERKIENAYEALFNIWGDLWNEWFTND